MTDADKASLKKRVPWYVLIGVAGGIVALMSGLGWDFWNGVSTTQAKEMVAKVDKDSRERDTALLERIKTVEATASTTNQQVLDDLKILRQRTYELVRDKRGTP